MLRIFSSLPRSHKFLLLPVTTMVTVLGAHELLKTEESPSSPEVSSIVQTSSLMPIRSAEAEGPEIAPAQGYSVDVASALALQAALAQRQPKQNEQIPPPNLVASANAGPSSQEESQARSDIRKRLFASLGRVGEDDPHYDDGFSADPLYLSEMDSYPGLSEEIDSHSAYVAEWQTYAVQPGDSFTSIASQSLGLGYSEVMNLLDAAPDAETRRLLVNMRVGSTLDYKLDEDGHLVGLKMMRNLREGVQLTRKAEGNGFDYANIARDVESTQRLFAGTVQGSFSQSAQATGLSSGEVAELTRTLSKKINFRRQAHDGDHFQVLVESDVIDGKPMSSRILAAQYQGSQTEISVIRYNDQFYTPDGKGLDPAFERYPFAGNHRLSSPFDLNRRHPVTGRVAPHHGTDFAMPTGTPIKAPANGRVVQVGSNRFAGRYVVIDHGNGMKTRYLHLSRALVSNGQQITMNDRIALSGSTGRVTGPHLHYEILVNNRPVDAMRLKLPGGQSLSGQQLANFRERSGEMLAKLNDARQGRAYANLQRSGASDDS